MIQYVSKGILLMSLLENNNCRSTKMAKAINNLRSLSPFIVEESVTTSLSNKWEEWLDDFYMYLLATGISQAQQKSLPITFNKKIFEGDL